MTTVSGDRHALLASLPLFSGMDSEHIELLSATAAEVPFPSGHVIAHQGEIGTGFFVVVEGRVRVIRDGTVVARLGPGEFFGELSVLDGLPRVAQVIADEPTRCLALASWDVERVLLDNPSVALAVIRGLARRLRETLGHHQA
jgi:CRP-like cAMP-binding protein